MSASKQIFQKSFATLLTDASKLRYPGFVGTVATTSQPTKGNANANAN